MNLKKKKEKKRKAPWGSRAKIEKEREMSQREGLLISRAFSVATF